MKRTHQLVALALGLVAAGAAQALNLPAPPSGQVPVPGVLALIGAGVLALYLGRRR